MASVQEHYDSVLAPVYSWIFGGLDQLIERSDAFFTKHQILPRMSGRAIDLGAGSGAQSITLARYGFKVTAIDCSADLLNEIHNYSSNDSINTVIGDLRNFKEYCENSAELVVCMTDTVLHLDSQQDIVRLFTDVHDTLEVGGKFVVTVRDLTQALPEEDQFIPLRQSRDKIASCFLEYEPETVKVYDLLYQLDGEHWSLHKSFYRKLRLSQIWLSERLMDVGFNLTTAEKENGLITLIAEKH